MSTKRRNAIERIVESFEMTAALPEDFDPEAPDIKAIIEAMPKFQQNAIKAFTQNPDVRKTSMKFSEIQGKYYRELLTAKENGKKIVFVPFNFIPELFYAMDMIPVCIEVLNTMAQMLEEGIEEYLDLSVERGLPDTMCSAQRGVVGMLEAGVLDLPDLLINGALGGCDPNTKIFEYISEKFDTPSLYVDIPYYHDKRALDYYTKGFKKVVNGLEKLSGKKLDPDRLRKVVDYSNHASELFFEINELKRNVPNPVPGIYNIQHTNTKLMQTGTSDAVEFYQTALDISQERLKQGNHVMPEERIRILFIYTGFYFDFSIYQWFEEEMGATYLMDALSFFDFNPIIDTSSIDSMLCGIAEEMLNLPMTRQLKGSWDMPANWLHDVLHYAKTYKADCIVFSGHAACKQAWGVYRLVADEVKKQLGIPSLRLEGDGWDGRITPISSIKEQFEEFFETLL